MRTYSAKITETSQRGKAVFVVFDVTITVRSVLTLWLHKSVEVRPILVSFERDGKYSTANTFWKDNGHLPNQRVVSECLCQIRRLKFTDKELFLAPEEK